MNGSIHVWLSVAAVLLCSVAARADEDIYNPLAVGLRWESGVEITTASGRVLRGTSIHEITGTETIAGKTYFVSVTRFDGLPGMAPFTTYRRKAADGIYAINGFDPQKREYLETALPLAVGNTWTAVTDDKTVFTVQGMEDKVVGERKYEKCLKIVRSADGSSPTGTFYLAPNVGSVMDTAQQGGATYRFTLRSFSGSK